MKLAFQTTQLKAMASRCDCMCQNYWATAPGLRLIHHN